MKPSFLVFALVVVVPSCGRDALVSPQTFATPLTCPAAFDDGSGNRGGSTLLLPTDQTANVPVQNVCTFGQPKVTDSDAMEALVRLVTGQGDPKRAREFFDKGLRTNRLADRSTVIAALLANAAARALSDEWMAKWLQLPAATPFPDRFSAALWQDAREQTFRQGRSVFVEGSNTLASLVNGTKTFVTPNLAALYTVMPPSNDGFAETSLPPSRPGVFGHVSVLGSQPAASLRGDFLLKAALGCGGAPPPPSGLPVHDIKPTKLVARQTLANQIVEPQCAACHRLLEVGFLLHAFDERGVARTRDSDGAALNTRATVDLIEGSPVELDGLATLGKTLEGNGAWQNCLAEALASVAAGRAQLPEADSTCSRAEAVAMALRQSPTLKAVLPAVATTLFGGTISPQGIKDGPAPPAVPPSPSIEVDGQLSACTPIRSASMTCDGICQTEQLRCGAHTCRLAGTLGGAFFFSSQSRCGSSDIAATLDEACGGGFGDAACNASAPLTWVRCCCGD